MKSLVVLAAIALLTPALPFPAPKLIPVTPETKCDWGPIASLGSDASRLVITTEAGPLTLLLSPETKVVGADGAQSPSIKSLQVGQSVRAYYVVRDGARLQEVDVVPKS